MSRAEGRARPGRAIEGAAPVFAALGEPTRLRLVARLCARGPQSIAELSEGEGVTRQAITKHLEVLAGAGLVRDAREGRARVFELAPRRLEQARRALDEISARWDAALDRLEAHLDGG